MSTGAKDLLVTLAGFAIMFAAVWGGLYLGTFVPEERQWIGAGIFCTALMIWLVGLIVAVEGGSSLSAHGWRK